MRYTFTCSGHKNILATHKTTLEFTKDKDLTEKGDCIIGINADFDLDKIKEFLNYKTITITITLENNPELTEIITCTPNLNFDDDKEIVIRLSTHDSKRTLGINSDKAAIHLNRELIKQIKNKNPKLIITISN